MPAPVVSPAPADGSPALDVVGRPTANGPPRAPSGSWDNACRRPCRHHPWRRSTHRIGGGWTAEPSDHIARISTDPGEQPWRSHPLCFGRLNGRRRAPRGSRGRVRRRWSSVSTRRLGGQAPVARLDGRSRPPCREAYGATLGRGRRTPRGDSGAGGACPMGDVDSNHRPLPSLRASSTALDDG